MQKVMLLQARGITEGAKTAALRGVHRADTFVINGDAKQIGVEWEYWQHGRSVDCVQHHPHNIASDVGEIVQLEWGGIGNIGMAKYTAIEMVDYDKLTDADLAALGYNSRQDFEENVAGRKGWLYRFEYLGMDKSVQKTMRMGGDEWLAIANRLHETGKTFTNYVLDLAAQDAGFKRAVRKEGAPIGNKNNRYSK